MNYSKAKAKAIGLVGQRKVDHAILFDGKNYSVEMISVINGEPFEIVSYATKTIQKKKTKRGIV